MRDGRGVGGGGGGGGGRDRGVDGGRGIFFSSLSFAVYTIKATREMNDVVFSSSCLQSWSLVVRGVLTGHTSSLAAL